MDSALQASRVQRCSISAISTTALPQAARPALSALRASSALPRLCTRRAQTCRVAQRRVIVQAAVDMKEEMQEFAAAEKRWRSQVRDGKVKSLTPKEAGYSYQLADYVLLDVRPSFEHDKGWVQDSVWVPAFEVDRSVSPGALLNKLTTFLFGGWWNGTVVTKRNERFMADVVAQIPKGANVIVVCQRGLRSLAACEHLYKAGYRNLYWVDGGFDGATEEDFKRAGPEPLNFAGIGGFSEFIGWTEPQRQKAAEEGLAYRAIFFAKLAGALIALDIAFIALTQLGAYFRGELQ